MIVDISVNVEICFKYTNLNNNGFKYTQYLTIVSVSGFLSSVCSLGEFVPLLVLGGIQILQIVRGGSCPWREWVAMLAAVINKPKRNKHEMPLASS